MNYLQLRHKFLDNNVEIQDVFKALGISRSALNRKMNGKSQFTREEINKLIGLLNLNSEEIMSIFFEEQVS